PFLYVVGHRAPGNLVTPINNLLYRIDPATGAVPASDYLNPNNPRIPTDAVQRSGLNFVTAPTIYTSDVTDTTGNISNPGDIRDGMTFSVTDGNGLTRTFEFDTGPDIRFTTPATSGNLVGDILFRDGETFALNGVTYEFDSGPVYVIQGSGTNFQ